MSTKGKYFSDVGVKLICVMLATALWFYTTKPGASKALNVISKALSKNHLNSTNTTNTLNASITLEDVPVVVKGFESEAKAKVAVSPPTVSVTLRVSKDEKMSINALNSIRFEVEIPNQGQGTVKLNPQSLSLPKDTQLISVSPKKVHVKFNKKR